MDNNNINDSKDNNTQTTIDPIVAFYIDSKICQSKLEITESRIRFLILIGSMFIAFFGIFMPLYISYQSTTKLDNALEYLTSRIDIAVKEANSRVDKMEVNVNELIGKQLREPEITILYDDKELNNDNILVNCDIFKISNTQFNIANKIKFKLINIGESAANDIKVMLYFEKDVHFRVPEDWYRHGPLDKPQYEIDEAGYSVVYSYEFEPRRRVYERLDSHEPPIILTLDKLTFPMGIYKSKALFKIFYGQKNPKKIPFKIELDCNE